MVSAAQDIHVRLGDILHALHAGAVVVDNRGVIVYANARFRELLCRQSEGTIGIPLDDILRPSGPNGDSTPVLWSLDEASEKTFVVPLPSGAERTLLVSGRAPLTDAPLSGLRIVTVIDVTALKEAEQRSLEQYRHIARLSDTVLEQALSLKAHSKGLERKVRQRTAALAEANREAIFMLAVASEVKDEETGNHVLRIRDYTECLARAVGIAGDEAERLGYAAIMHDVGKIHVPDEILKKPGALNDEEWAIMQEHTLAGEHILSKSPYFAVARQIARSHHENWDGGGYPDRLKGEQIPLAARITRLADVFDALTNARPYKPAWPLDEAVAAIIDGKGTLFDPNLVDVFLKLLRTGEWQAIMRRHCVDADPDVPLKAEVLGTA
jgi:response regulator RpfG family c-di-GMP phosphodiesterase